MKDPFGDVRTVDPLPVLFGVQSFARPNNRRAVSENVVTLVHQFLVVLVMLGQSNVVGICKVHRCPVNLQIVN